MIPFGPLSGLHHGILLALNPKPKTVDPPDPKPYAKPKTVDPPDPKPFALCPLSPRPETPNPKLLRVSTSTISGVEASNASREGAQASRISGNILIANLLLKA